MSTRAALNLRFRSLQVAPFVLAFAAIGLLATDGDLADQAWLFIGVAMALSSVLQEPYYVSPRAAVINSAAALVTVLTVSHGAIEDLWTVLGVSIGMLLAGSFYAAASNGTRTPSQVAYELARRCGGAVPIGLVLLFAYSLTLISAGRRGSEAIAGASLLLAVGLSVDWTRYARTRSSGLIEAEVVAAIGPRQVLIRSSNPSLGPGDSLTIHGSDSSTGRIVALLPHREGTRYRVSLDSDWTAVSRRFPSAVRIEKARSDEPIVGFVGAGSTDSELRFEAVTGVEVGDPLTLGRTNSRLLYQVVGSQLEHISWEGSHMLTAQSSAFLVGGIEGSALTASTYLPRPHEEIRRGNELQSELPGDSFVGLGVAKGTQLKIGFRSDETRRGHLAILGMSGMGKTAVAHRICDALGSTAREVVVALDSTGEYSNRLGFDSWLQGDFESAGAYVFEPAGDQPQAARNFIHDCMSEGEREFRSGEDPRRRVVLLEEAHTYLPEWMIATKPQADHVAYSTRMIMQARKFGLSFIIVSQRTAVVSKSALSQCENYIILKTLDQTGLEYLESLVGPRMREAIPRLGRFEALCVGPAFNSEGPVVVTLTPPDRQDAADS